MHATLHADIRGYIDDITTNGANVTLSGWTFYFKEMTTRPLRALANSQVYEVTRLERADVGNSYKCQGIINCGWKFTVPKNVQSHLQMNVNDVWINVFNFDIQPPAPAATAPVAAPEAAPVAAPAPKAPVAPIVPITDTPYKISRVVPSFLVVDNFYENPDEVRKFALSRTFHNHPEYHKGRRTDECYRFAGLKERFEQLLGRKVTNWEKYGTNGCFQYCIAGDQLVYHHDSQLYAGVLYLTPDAPPQTGTSLYRSKYTKKMKVPSTEHDMVFKNGFLDETEFELVDVIGNVYNRLILFDSHMIHAASKYFGTTKENSRFFQLFFFDLE